MNITYCILMGNCTSVLSLCLGFKVLSGFPGYNSAQFLIKPICEFRKHHERLTTDAS